MVIESIAPVIVPEVRERRHRHEERPERAARPMRRDGRVQVLVHLREEQDQAEPDELGDDRVRDRDSDEPLVALLLHPVVELEAHALRLPGAVPPPPLPPLAVLVDVLRAPVGHRETQRLREVRLVVVRVELVQGPQEGRRHGGVAGAAGAARAAAAAAAKASAPPGVHRPEGPGAVREGGDGVDGVVAVGVCDLDDLLDGDLPLVVAGDGGGGVLPAGAAGTAGAGAAGTAAAVVLVGNGSGGGGNDVVVIDKKGEPAAGTGSGGGGGGGGSDWWTPF